MLIRHAAAVKQLNHCNLRDRISLLVQIVRPSAAVYEASMQVAREKEPSQMAAHLARTNRVTIERALKAKVPVKYGSYAV